MRQFDHDRVAWNTLYGARHKICSILRSCSEVAFVLSGFGVLLLTFFQRHAGSFGHLILIGAGVAVFFGTLAKLYSCPDPPNRPTPDPQARFGQPIVVFTPNTAADGNLVFSTFQNGYPPDWDRRRLDCLQRDSHSCRLCASTQRLHVHHIKPISFGGSHSLQNLITLCHACHMSQEYYRHRELVSHNVKANSKHWVKPYTKSDGVVVEGHSRRVGRRGRFWKSIWQSRKRNKG